jgi:FAD/FMN-containing dehydrogenase
LKYTYVPIISDTYTTMDFRLRPQIPSLLLTIFTILNPLMAATAQADLCSTLQTAGITVEYPLALNYTTDLLHYWSAACSNLKPTCMLAPSSAQEVADIIVALQQQDDDDLFAVKSGGHMPNIGFASIQDGLLILTKNLNDVIYNPNTQTAVVGPGLSWEEAQQKLTGTGRVLVGGRMGGVGVGGYILGGKQNIHTT